MHAHTHLDSVPRGTITVGVDGSAASTDALEWAADQAVIEHRPLLIVHALGPVGTPWQDQAGGDNRIGHMGQPLDHTAAALVLDAATESAQRRAPAVEIHQLLRVSDPRDVLRDLSRHSAMLVVGSHGRGPLRSLLLGSVGAAVVRHARCPVAVIRSQPSTPAGKGVLVGLETSSSSSDLLEFAYRRASERRLPLTILHASLRTRRGAVAGTPATGGTVAHSGLITGLETDEERLLVAEAIAGMTEKFPDVTARLEMVHGLPGETLLQASDGMDLVVVGSTGGGAASDVLFGSIAAFMVEHATCPVAVVPTRAPD